MMSAEVVMIGRQWAIDALAKSQGNRKIRPSQVKAYARDILAGSYRLNGQGIVFDRLGVLRDGHHRLAAIIEASASDADISVAMLVVRNADEASKWDIGKSRSNDDHLTMAGYANGKMLATLVRFINNWNDSTGFPARLLTPTAAEQDAIVASNPSIVTAIHETRTRAHTILMPNSQKAFVWWLLDRTTRDDALAWLTQMFVGDNLGSDDPRFVVRQRLQRDYSSYRGSQDRAKEAIGMCIKAWNAYVTGRPLGIARVRLDQAYPIPMDLRTGGPN